MPKVLSRIVTCLLVPCLAGDALIPAGAATFGNREAAFLVDPALASGRIGETNRRPSGQYFSCQALSPAAISDLSGSQPFSKAPAELARVAASELESLTQKPNSAELEGNLFDYVIVHQEGDLFVHPEQILNYPLSKKLWGVQARIVPVKGLKDAMGVDAISALDSYLNQPTVYVDSAQRDNGNVIGQQLRRISDGSRPLAKLIWKMDASSLRSPALEPFALPQLDAVFTPKELKKRTAAIRSILQRILSAGPNKEALRYLSQELYATAQNDPGVLKALLLLNIHNLSITPEAVLQKLEKHRGAILKGPLDRQTFVPLINSSTERVFYKFSISGETYFIIIPGLMAEKVTDKYIESETFDVGALLATADMRGHSHPRYQTATPSLDDKKASEKVIKNEEFIIALQSDGELTVNYRAAGQLGWKLNKGQDAEACLVRLSILRPAASAPTRDTPPISQPPLTHFVTRWIGNWWANRQISVSQRHIDALKGHIYLNAAQERKLKELQASQVQWGAKGSDEREAWLTTKFAPEVEAFLFVNKWVAALFGLIHGVDDPVGMMRRAIELYKLGQEAYQTGQNKKDAAIARRRALIQSHSLMNASKAGVRSKSEALASKSDLTPDVMRDGEVGVVPFNTFGAESSVDRTFGQTAHPSDSFGSETPGNVSQGNFSDPNIMPRGITNSAAQPGLESVSRETPDPKTQNIADLRAPEAQSGVMLPRGSNLDTTSGDISREIRQIFASKTKIQAKLALERAA